MYNFSKLSHNYEMFSVIKLSNYREIGNAERTGQHMMCLWNIIGKISRKRYEVKSSKKLKISVGLIQSF